LWGRTAEVAGEYLKKGRPVFIEGRLQLDSWEDKQSGQKRSKLRVVAEGMQLIGSRGGSGSSEGDEAASSSRSSGSRTTPPPKNAPPAAPDDDEIPF
jgi:single-strand DNA-binding protein